MCTGLVRGADIRPGALPDDPGICRRPTLDGTSASCILASYVISGEYPMSIHIRTIAEHARALLIEAVVAAHERGPLTSVQLAKILGMPVNGATDLAWAARDCAVRARRLKKHDGLKWELAGREADRRHVDQSG